MKTKQQIGEEMDRIARRLTYLAENEWDSGTNGPSKEVLTEHKRLFKEWKSLLKQYDALA